VNKFLLLIALIVLTACGSKTIDGSIGYGEPFKNIVTRVVDGDTVVFNGDFANKPQSYKGRLLGIDTPETVHPRKPVEKWGKEATAFVIKWIAEHDEWVEYINKKDDKDGKDHYGRHLIWIVSDDGNLHMALVRNGLARVKFYGNKHLKYAQELLDAEKEAKAKKIGIWSE